MKTSKFAQYAAAASNRMFLGTLVKFVKGEWEEGRDRAPISPAKPFVAVMDSAATGHMKWFGGKVVDSRMGLIADEFRPLHRNELDDLDSATWETDEYGDRKDPWQKTTLLVLISPTAPHDLFTFTTTSVGGESAVAELCGAHGATTEGVGQYPVVTLASDSYEHKIKSRGRIDVPVFKVVDSIAAAPFNAMVAGTRGGAVFIPASPPPLATPGAPPAITSGRVRVFPPEPPEPSTEDIETTPPLEHDGGPDYDSEIPF